MPLVGGEVGEGGNLVHDGSESARVVFCPFPFFGEGRFEGGASTFIQCFHKVLDDGALLIVEGFGFTRTHDVVDGDAFEKTYFGLDFGRHNQIRTVSPKGSTAVFCARGSFSGRAEPTDQLAGQVFHVHARRVGAVV